jgi:hypothetical protein
MLETKNPGQIKTTAAQRLFTSFSYQQSLTSITNSDYFADSKIRHNGMSFTIGVKCDLTKESLSKTAPAKNQRIKQCKAR